MRIRSITACPLRAGLSKPIRFSQWTHDYRATTLVAVETDDGLRGWGEAYGPASTVAEAVTSFFAPLLAGRDPWEHEALWHLMFARSLDWGQKGAMVAAISAIDIALWDVKARAAGVPLYRMLGGARVESIPGYATGFYFDEDDTRALARSFAAEAERYRALGFRAMKLKVGLGVAADAELVGAVRGAAGPGVRVMMDANHAYDATTAIALGRRVEALDIAWFEEPVSPLDLDGYVEVRRALRIPIAGGECEYTRFGFDALFRRRALDYAQPDVCACGGITEAMKIATLASVAGVHVTPHVWGSAVGQAAAVHFYAARPPHPGSLVPEDKLIECDQSENPLRTEIADEPLRIDQGRIFVPQGPGLGIEINPAALARFSPG
jgi:D-galactarolactone cycloisomerase